MLYRAMVFDFLCYRLVCKSNRIGFWVILLEWTFEYRCRLPKILLPFDLDFTLYPRDYRPLPPIKKGLFAPGAIAPYPRLKIIKFFRRHAGLKLKFIHQEFKIVQW